MNHRFLDVFLSRVDWRTDYCFHIVAGRIQLFGQVSDVNVKRGVLSIRPLCHHRSQVHADSAGSNPRSPGNDAALAGNASGTRNGTTRSTAWAGSVRSSCINHFSLRRFLYAKQCDTLGTTI